MKTNLAISRQMSMKIDAANIQIHLEKNTNATMILSFQINVCRGIDDPRYHKVGRA
jgi:hypothetical protein